MPLILNHIGCIKSRISQRLRVHCVQSLLTTVPKGVIWRSALNLKRPCSYSCPAPATWVDILIFNITRSSHLIFTATGIGFASIAVLCLSNAGVTLEPPPQQLAQILQGGQTRSQGKVLFVKPSVKNETIGNGSERTPFKTITQALRIAQPNMVIVLSTGTYSASSGETFPLILKPGVSIQGNPRTRGRNIVIQGGGTFFSPTFARQNITILGANHARVTGVSVTNPNPRGYGLWIESSSPIVINNTFTRNSHDGISITGNSAPIIRSNYFYQNGANGMTIYGTSRPEVRENVFEKTGFGINIAQKAAPVLLGNRITKNRTGIVAQANARPLLRGNVIEGNKEDGVVVIATSQPNLGTRTKPGGNIFRQNGRYDINSSASSQVIPAVGNTIANARISGSVDFTGMGSSVATHATNQISSQVAVLQSEPAQLSQSADKEARTTTNITSIDIPVPMPESTAQVSPTLNRQTDGSVETLPVLKPAPIVASELLPVPSSNIPIGDPRSLPTLLVPKNSRVPYAGSPPLPPTRATALGLSYRVVVEAASASKQALVRSLVPGAFRTFSKGRVLMQAGAFSDRAKADQIRRMLNSKGLRATIQQLN
jgi:parallel beta-helix repeat protein